LQISIGPQGGKLCGTVDQGLRAEGFVIVPKE
jgi:hypothetical protein